MVVVTVGIVTSLLVALEISFKCSFLSRFSPTSIFLFQLHPPDDVHPRHQRAALPLGALLLVSSHLFNTS